MGKDFLDPSISDEEFVRRFAKAMEEYLKASRAEDYVVNPAQMAKFNELVRFFTKAADDLDGRIEDVDFNTVFGTGDLTANFVVFDLNGKEVQKFCDVIRHCSAIGMDVTDTDKVCISCTIPNVFVHK